MNIKKTAQHKSINKTLSLPLPQKMAADHRVSPEFLQSREDIYRLVDIIDHLFDEIIIDAERASLRR